MLVVQKKKAIVFNLKNTARVTQVIPTAKPFVYKGKTLLAVPYRLDEAKVLNNLGFKVPSPIRYFYKWPGRFKPFKHQLTTTEFLTLNTRAFCLNDMGTGKTLSVLWAIDYLMSIGQVHKVLIVSPLSTLERVWGDEIFTNLPRRSYTVVHSYNRERRVKLLEQESDFYITNHDGVKVLRDELAARADIDCVVIDELAAFRNGNTERFKAMKEVSAGRTWVWGLTGSPTPNAPTDAWAQCKLIAPDRVPKYFGRFRDLTMRKVTQFKWVAREEALTVVKDAMQPAIRFKRDECIDLPPTMVTTRQVEMSPEQKRMYKDMLNKLKAECAAGQVLAVNEAVKMTKLLQISCGVAYGMDGESVVIPAPQRIEVVREIIEEAEGKVIVFVPLTGALEHVAKELRRDYSVEVIHGETPVRKRDSVFRDFQQAADPRVLVAHPKTMSHGLTLTAATVIVWFLPVYDNETYQQACARIARPGQTKHTLIVHVEGSEVERRVYNKLAGKEAMQGTLLAMIKEEADVS